MMAWLNLQSFLSLRIATSVEVLSVFGLAQNDKVPQLVTSKRSKEDGQGTLLEVLFEINPGCRTCDQRIHVTAKPLQVVYDAETLIHVSIFIKQSLKRALFVLLCHMPKLGPLSLLRVQ